MSFTNESNIIGKCANSDCNNICVGDCNIRSCNGYDISDCIIRNHDIRFYSDICTNCSDNEDVDTTLIPEIIKIISGLTYNFMNTVGTVESQGFLDALNSYLNMENIKNFLSIYNGYIRAMKNQKSLKYFNNQIKNLDFHSNYMIFKNSENLHITKADKLQYNLQYWTIVAEKLYKLVESGTSS